MAVEVYTNYLPYRGPCVMSLGLQPISSHAQIYDVLITRRPTVKADLFVAYSNDGRWLVDARKQRAGKMNHTIVVRYEPW